MLAMLSAAPGSDTTVPMKVEMAAPPAPPGMTAVISGAAAGDSDGAPGSGLKQLPVKAAATKQDPGAPPGLDAPVGRTSLRTPLRSRAQAYVPAAAAYAAWATGTAQRAETYPNKQTKASKEAARAEEERTTVMICHLPFSYTCNTLIDLLESKGWSKRFDFVYVPINFNEMLGVGYAFVNLMSHEQAKQFMAEFEGFDGWASSFSKKPCELRWSDCQGIDGNIARYRNSPIMGPDVPSFYKPALLKDGARVPFPEPTRKLRALKSRRSRNQYMQEKTEAEEAE